MNNGKLKSIYKTTLKESYRNFSKLLTRVAYGLKNLVITPPVCIWKTSALRDLLFCYQHNLEDLGKFTTQLLTYKMGLVRRRIKLFN